MFYLGFADGLFGLHCLRFNLGLFMIVLVFLYVYVCVIRCRFMVGLALASLCFNAYLLLSF